MKSKSEFINKLYNLSEKNSSLDFFDKIKSATEKWIDKELLLPYELTLEKTDNDYYVLINFNKPDEKTLTNEEIDKDIDECERFEGVFDKKTKGKRLYCNYNADGDYEIRNDL